jgi:hypothetical protein
VTHTHMRAATVDFLRKLQERGDIPDDVNVDDTQIVPDEIDPRTIDVQLPWLLRLYLQDGLESVRTPRFKHDSDCCRFLAPRTWLRPVLLWSKWAPHGHRASVFGAE